MQVSSIVACGSETSILYPKITIFSEKTFSDEYSVNYPQSLIYYHDPSISNEKYTIKYLSDDNTPQKKSSNIKIPFVSFQQTATTDSRSDFIIELDNISKKEEDAIEYTSITYTAMNIGTKPALLPQITAWESLTAPLSEIVKAVNRNFHEEIIEFFSGAHTFLPKYICLQPSDSFNHSVPANFRTSTGNAYIMIDSDNEIDELDELNNFSSSYSW